MFWLLSHRPALAQANPGGSWPLHLHLGILHCRTFLDTTLELQSKAKIRLLPQAEKFRGNDGGRGRQPSLRSALGTRVCFPLISSLCATHAKYTQVSQWVQQGWSSLGEQQLV